MSSRNVLSTSNSSHNTNDIDIDSSLMVSSVNCGENGKVSMEQIVWKQVFSQKRLKKEGELQWEKQRLVLDGSKVCAYKFASSKPETPTEDKAILDKDRYKQMDQSKLLFNAVARSLKKASSSTGLKNEKNVSINTISKHKLEETRSSLDMLTDKVEVKGLIAGVPIVDGNASSKIQIPSLSSLAGPLVSGPSKLKVGFTPTPFEMGLRSKRCNVKWRICFETEQTLREWIAALKCIKLDAKEAKKPGINEDHGFKPGDHIIRWTILPIPAWPVQIHGIVLEAGRNCVIIADFGLTSYGKEESGISSEEAAKTEEEGDQTQQQMTETESKHFDKVLKSFKSMQPKERKRLNVVVLTHTSEIKKWSKVGYGMESKLKSGGHLSHLKVPKWISSQINKITKTNENEKPIDTTKQYILQHQQHQQLIQQRIDALNQEQLASAEKNGRWAKKGHVDFSENEDNTSDANTSAKGRWQNKTSPTRKRRDKSHLPKSQKVDQPKTSLSNDRKETSSYENTEEEKVNSDTSSPDKDNNDSSSDAKSNSTQRKGRWVNKKVNIEQKEDEDESENKLPSSDPAEIVLARTHFLLEHGDDFLPSYHPFHSNSECIAVWCKTGQWSTLQASVFLTSTCIGNAKSATVLTMGAAAAHAVLFPAFAVGGMVMVTAPYVILMKSKDKWHKTTIKLNDIFWSMAGPDVYISAIKNWSGMKFDD